MLWEVLLRCRFNLINGQFSNCSKILLLGGLFSCISWKKSPSVSFCFGYESEVARKHSKKFNYPLILSIVNRGGWMECCRKNSKELSNTHSVSIGWWTFCCKSVGGCLGAKAFCWRDRHSDIQGRRRPTVWWQEGNSSAQRGWERKERFSFDEIGYLKCWCWAPFLLWGANQWNT